MEKEFKLLFYYESRNRIRNSFFLDYIKKLKAIVLNNYTLHNYSNINNGLTLLRTLIINAIYFIIYKATYAKEEVGQTAFVLILMVFLFFAGLMLLQQNKEVQDNIHKNHYYRMLGKDRNKLLKAVMTNRINRYTFNAVMPFTIGLALFTGLTSSMNFFIAYIAILFLFRYLFQVVLFLTQRLFFEHLRVVPFVYGILTMVITSLSLIVIVAISVFPFLLESRLTVPIHYYIVYILIEAIIIFLAYLLEKNIKKHTMNYSITNVIVNTRDKKKRINRIEQPHRIFKWYLTTDSFLNALFLKDVYSLLREKKSYLISTITSLLMFLFYQFFIVVTFFENAETNTNFFVDVLITGILLLFFMSNFFSLKNNTFYSSEWEQLRHYRILGYDKYDIYRAKKRTNYYIMYFFFAIATIPSIGGIFTFEINIIIQCILRTIYCYLIYTFVIDYHLLQDVKNKRKLMIDPLRGIGTFNFTVALMVIFTIAPLFLTFKIPNLELPLAIIMVTTLAILKLNTKRQESKLKGCEIT